MPTNSFPYRSEQVLMIVREPKRIRGKIGVFGDYQNEKLDLIPDNTEITASISLRITIPDTHNIETYRAALLIDNQRIRGIDYSSISRRKYYREVVSKGWHENIINPNLPDSDVNRNRHDPILNVNIIDVVSFLRLLSQKWNILNLIPEEDLLW